jgi:hypothetical protein
LQSGCSKYTLSSVLMKYYSRSLINLSARVQEVRTSPLDRRNDCLAVQEDLLRRIVYVEKSIKELRSQIKDSRARRKETDQGRNV